MTHVRWFHLLAICLLVVGSAGTLNRSPVLAAAEGTGRTSSIPQFVGDPSPAAAPTLLESNAQHIVLEWRAPTPQVVADSVDGRPVQRVTVAGCSPAGRPGEPELPLCTTLLGVPPDAALDLNVLEEETLPLPGTFHLAPVFTQVVEEKLPPDGPRPMEATGEVWAEGAAYGGSSFPAQPAALGEPAFLRHQRLVAVSFYPLQYSPTSGEVRYRARLLLEVTLHGAQEPTAAVAEPPAFEQLLAHSLLNYSAAREWRRATVAPVDIPPAPPNPGYRIPVRQEGVYKLTYQQLQAAGLPVDTLDPRTLRLFRYGQEVAIRVVGEADGSLDPGDSLLFYGQPLLGNRYTGDEVYWLTYGGVPGRRMARRDGTPSGSDPVPASFFTTERLEQEHEYLSSAPWRAEHDHWFWNHTYPEGGIPYQTYTFPGHVLAAEAYTATFRLHLNSTTRDDTVHPDHHMLIRLNGTLISERWWDGKVELTPTISFPSTLLGSSGNTVRVECPGDTGALVEYAVYDWLELGQRRLFTAEGDGLRWSGTAGAWEYHLDNFPEPAIHLFDTSDPDGPVEIVSATVVPAGSGYSLYFADAVSQTTTYRAVADGQTLAPASITLAAPAGLRDPANSADYLVITHGDFYAQAQTLATFRSGQGLRTMVVDVADVYDLFAYGRRYPEAIRDFLDYAYTSWTAPLPAYAVLLGDGHYDARNYYGYGVGNYILPYLAFVDPWLGETAADNRYVCLSGTDYLPDMFLGRLPANTAQQAQVMVSKIVAYEGSPPPGDWRLQSLFVADNADDMGDFARLSDGLIAGYYPAPYVAQRVYLGETCPYQNPSSTCHSEVIANVNSGRLLVSYTGHAGAGLWASEQLLNLYDPGRLSNGPYYPVALPMTCYEGAFHYPYSDWRYFALSETFLRAEGKGWAASWSPTGLGVATGHHYLAEGFFLSVFHDDEPRIGPGAVAGKLRLFQYGSSPDLLDTYTLLGDPALAMPLLDTDLSLDKTAYPSTPLQPGDPLTFTLHISNAGPATAHHVVLTDTLSPYIVGAAVEAVGVTLTERPAMHFVWDVADMVAGQAGTVTVTAYLSLAAPAGPLTNEAHISTSARETDSQNNSDLATWQVVPGPPYAVQVTADPPALPADGASIALIWTHVVDTAGNAVADGTLVAFSTDAGTFADGSTHYTGTTAQGDAEVFLRAANQVLTATVTVTSGQAVGQVAVPFLSTDPYTVRVVAEPPAIPVTGTARITTTVSDVMGHPVRDGTLVTLTTSLGWLTPTVGGTQAGIVTATLHGDGFSGLATVIARSGRAAGATAVRIGTGGDYTLTLAVTPTSLPADGASQALVLARLVRVDGRPITGTHWITFSATLGSITPTLCQTSSGIATATLTADTRTGTALLAAAAERVSAYATVVFLPGAAADLTLTVSPLSVPVGGASALATADVRDAHGNAVADGTLVTFSTDLGAISPTVGATQAGQARTVLLSGAEAGTATITASAGPAGDTAWVRFLPLEPFTLTLSADPQVVVADGQSAAAIAAWVSDRFGNAVEDGTTVEFHTSLGTLWPTQAGTVQGWATAALTSTTVGTATVECFSGFAGQAQGQALVRFIPGPPAVVLVTAQPARIYADGVTTATITAYLWDAWGHPAADGTLVTLSTSLGSIAPAVTPALGGQAQATLRSSPEPGWAVVQATSGPAGGQAWVEFYRYRLYLPLVLRGGQ